MKKILIGLVALFAASSVFADGGGFERSGSISGTVSGTGAAAGGYTYGNAGYSGSYQFSASGANNTTGANFTDPGGYNDRSIGSEAHSIGSTYSYSYGSTLGPNATGATVGLAAQGGIAAARSGGYVVDPTGYGAAGTISGAAAGSISHTGVYENDESYNQSWSHSRSVNNAELAIHNGEAIHHTDSLAEAGGGSDGFVEGTAFQVGAGGGIAAGFAVTVAETGDSSPFEVFEVDDFDGEDMIGGCVARGGTGNCGVGLGLGGGNGTHHEGNNPS